MEEILLEQKRARLYAKANKKINGLVIGNLDYLYWVDYKKGLLNHYADINNKTIPFALLDTQGYRDGYAALTAGKRGRPATGTNRILQVRLPAETFNQIKIICKELQIDKSKFARKSIERQLEQWRNENETSKYAAL